MVHLLEVRVALADHIERHALEPVARQVEAREHRLDEVRHRPHALDLPQARDDAIELRRQSLELRPDRPTQERHVGEVGRVVEQLPVGAQLHLGASHGLVRERAAGDGRVEADARHERHDQQECHRPVRLHRDVAHGDASQTSANRLDERRHHLLDPVAVRRQHGGDAVEEQRETEEVEQTVDRPHRGVRRDHRHREIEHPAAEHVDAQDQRHELEHAEPHPRLGRFRGGHARRRLERGDGHRVPHKAARHDQGEHDRNHEEPAVDQDLLRLQEDLQPQATPLVEQQRADRAAHQAQHAADETARDDRDHQRAAHRLPRDATQPHQAQRAALVEHQQASQVAGEDPGHPEQRQGDQQRQQAHEPGDPFHAAEQDLGGTVHHELTDGARRLLAARGLSLFVHQHQLGLGAVPRHRRIEGRVLDVVIHLGHARERSGDVPARDQPVAVELAQVHHLGLVLGQLNVAGVRVPLAHDLEGHDARGDRVETGNDVGIVGHQQDDADVRDVADRTGLVHEPAVQLVAVQPDDTANGRAEKIAHGVRHGLRIGRRGSGPTMPFHSGHRRRRLLLELIQGLGRLRVVHLHADRELLRPLKGEERPPHGPLGPDEREHGAFERPVLAVARLIQGERQLRRQDRRIGRGQQAQPRGGERLAVDLAQDLATLWKPRPQERQVRRLRDPVDLADRRGQHVTPRDAAALVDGKVPGNTLELILHVQLERVPRRQIHRRQQRAHEERHQSEGDKGSTSENAQ